MITVWGRASSSNVQAVMWAIEELGLSCERHDVGFIYGGNNTPEFLAMNPNGTVPVLQDGDNVPIWESGAILRYIASVYGDAPFWPKDLHARSQIDQWAEWAKVNISHKFTGPIFWPVVRTAPSQRDPKAIQDAITKLGGSLVIAEQQLAKQSFLASDDLSLADIQLGHLLYRYYDIKIDRPDFPYLRKYYDRLRDRPAFIKHVVVSYDELRVED